MLRMIATGLVDPSQLVTRTVSLAEGVEVLKGMDGYDLLGIAVIDSF